MTGISNNIEDFIKGLFLQSDTDEVEIQRNELADRFMCAPSQITYVLTTRFTPYQGYYVESKRDGGGGIRIMKVALEETENFEELLVETIGQKVTKNHAFRIVESLCQEGLITEREMLLFKAALEDRSLNECPVDMRNELRASILKNMLLMIIKE